MAAPSFYCSALLLMTYSFQSGAGIARTPSEPKCITEGKVDVKRLERWGMSRKRIVRVHGDVREHPRYSVNEAASYLDIPSSTLHSWIRDDGPKHRPLIYAVDPKQSLLSFYNLVEAHILVSTRRRKIPMPKVRIAVEYMHKRSAASIH